MKQLQSDLRSNLLFVFRHFPLAEIHPFALPAAAAAEAAGLQMHSWAMHNRLFERQQQLDPASLLQHARALRLHVDRFVSDAQSPNVQRRIAGDMEGGARSGVNGTPTFFANGLRVDGGYAYENLAAALNRAASVRIATVREGTVSRCASTRRVRERKPLLSASAGT